jgi:short-subunit dehydrogenase
VPHVLVTGASSGIGRALALALASPESTIHLVGRDAGRLQEVAGEVEKQGARPQLHTVDLVDDDALRHMAARPELSTLDVLVHAAGTVSLGPVATLPVAALDAQYQLNARAPYLLTQLLIPALRQARGQVVMINSGAGLNARATWASYAMTKFALRALADALREELKPDGIRVISVYPGRTATPMQAEVHRQEGRAYDPARFIRPEDVALMVAQAVSLPRTSNVHEINIRHPE